MATEAMMKEKFYITTPIYYPSNKLTLGNAYTNVICDAIARFNRKQGKDVFYLTGTDEHGQKISQSAEAAGKEEKEYLDEIVEDTKELWKTLNISYDKFIRTTDSYHEKAVQKIFTDLYNKGYIYKGSYKGLYCTPCESFWTESQLVDGKCPDCGREVKFQEEEAYFFKLSSFGDKILKLYEENPDFLLPKSRVNEMVNNLQEHVTRDVYDAYEPYVYERRIGRTGPYAPIESQEYIDYNLSDNTLIFSYEPQGAHWVERWSNKHNGDNLIVSIQTGDLAGNPPPRPYWNRFVSEMENGGILSAFASGMKPYTLQTEGKDVVFAGNESMLEAQGSFTSESEEDDHQF